MGNATPERIINRAPTVGEHRRKGEKMKSVRGTIDAASIHYLMNHRTVCETVATFHVDANAATVAARVGSVFSDYETAKPRDIFYITAACVARHYSNRAAYTVAMRAAS
jgi:hypothetical protein